MEDECSVKVMRDLQQKSPEKYLPEPGNQGITDCSRTVSNRWPTISLTG